MARKTRSGGRGGRGSLPSPGVRFGEDLRGRLEACVDHRARGGNREAGGRGSWIGAGVEVEGRRPYRPGEDVRTLDWELLARDDRPFVRTLRREAGERWGVAVDTSASMGLGEPGKLQAAAELAAGLCAVGLASGAEVVVLESRGGRGEVLRRPADLERCLVYLEGLEAGEGRGLDALGTDPRWRDTDTLFCLGDALPSIPVDGPPNGSGPSLRPFLGAGRRVGFHQVLSPEERGVVPWDAGEWILVDPEGGGELTVGIDAETLGAYRRELLLWIEATRSSVTRMGAHFWLLPSDGRFEERLRECLG